MLDVGQQPPYKGRAIARWAPERSTQARPGIRALVFGDPASRKPSAMQRRRVDIDVLESRSPS